MDRGFLRINRKNDLLLESYINRKKTEEKERKEKK